MVVDTGPQRPRTRPRHFHQPQVEVARSVGLVGFHIGRRPDPAQEAVHLVAGQPRDAGAVRRGDVLVPVARLAQAVRDAVVPDQLAVGRPIHRVDLLRPVGQPPRRAVARVIDIEVAGRAVLRAAIGQPRAVRRPCKDLDAARQRGPQGLLVHEVGIGDRRPYPPHVFGDVGRVVRREQRNRLDQLPVGDPPEVERHVLATLAQVIVKRPGVKDQVTPVGRNRVVGQLANRDRQRRPHDL